MKVALLGAAGTGKSWLTRALARHWPAHVFLDAPDLGEAVDWDRVLLMGLDWPEGALPRDATSQASRRAEDTRLRAWLDIRGRVYGVVYGQGPQRLRAARQQLFPEEGPVQHTQGRWRGVCESCADPDCELRLFTRARSLGQRPYCTVELDGGRSSAWVNSWAASISSKR